MLSGRATSPGSLRRVARLDPFNASPPSRSPCEVVCLHPATTAGCRKHSALLGSGARPIEKHSRHAVSVFEQQYRYARSAEPVTIPASCSSSSWPERSKRSEQHRSTYDKSLRGRGRLENPLKQVEDRVACGGILVYPSWQLRQRSH